MQQQMVEKEEYTLPEVQLTEKALKEDLEVLFRRERDNSGRGQQRGDFESRLDAQSDWNQDREVIGHRCGKSRHIAPNCFVPRENSVSSFVAASLSDGVNRRTNQGIWAGQTSGQKRRGAYPNQRRVARHTISNGSNVVYDSQGNK